MGYVYKARDRRLRRYVAIKKMLSGSTGADGKALLEGFRAEAMLVAEINHPYIVSIHDLLEIGEELYLVFEYVDGFTVADLIVQRRAIDPRETVRILKFVSQALQYAHDEKGIIHRDLKPSNIMRDKRGDVKLMDFGIARRSTGKTALESGPQEPAVGTWPYMAPEQHLGSSVKASDIFALGATAYEMLTGELPFNGPAYLALKERRMFKPLPAAVPEPLRRLVEACFAVKPEDRPSLADFQKQLAT